MEALTHTHINFLFIWKSYSLFRGGGGEFHEFVYEGRRGGRAFLKIAHKNSQKKGKKFSVNPFTIIFDSSPLYMHTYTFDVCVCVGI